VAALAAGTKTASAITGLAKAAMRDITHFMSSPVFGEAATSLARGTACRENYQLGDFTLWIEYVK
jgi:hypothetical protein